MVSQQSIAFPFTFEPVSPARLQLWAQYVVQVGTLEQMSIVDDVFSGFYWDFACVDHVQWILSSLESGAFHYVVAWLDVLLSSVMTGLSWWSSVLQSLEKLLGEAVAADQWYQDAYERVQILTLLSRQVAEYVLVVCMHYRFDVPPRTTTFFEEGK